MLQGLTRGQFKQTAMRRARIFDGTEGDSAGDPDTIDEMLEDVVDRIVGETKAAYLTFQTDLVANQDLYCRPELEEILNVHIANRANDGTFRPLAVMDEITANLAMPDWQVRIITGDPLYAFLEGQGQIHLYGTPDYGITGGLIMRGFGYYSRALWPNDTSTAPFRDRWTGTILNGLTWILCENEGTPEYLARGQIYGRRFIHDKGILWGEVATEVEGRRSRASVLAPTTSWSNSDVGNPLNL